jgi:hypothetical protein
MSERRIHRYEHNYFQGWVVSTKRRGKRFIRYFSDPPHGRAAALRAARSFRMRDVASWLKHNGERGKPPFPLVYYAKKKLSSSLLRLG